MHVVPGNRYIDSFASAHIFEVAEAKRCEDSMDDVSSSRPIEKWHEAAVAGWQALPDVLLKNQTRLELSHTEMGVLINVLSHWWHVEKNRTRASPLFLSE